MEHRLEQYISLLDAFLRESISAVEFERLFLITFKSDTTMWPPALFKILDTLFGDIDAFCADEGLREEGDLSEQELRVQCAQALKALKGHFFSSEEG